VIGRPTRSSVRVVNLKDAVLLFLLDDWLNAHPREIAAQIIKAFARAPSRKWDEAGARTGVGRAL
jgi:hypothetical protein